MPKPIQRGPNSWQAKIRRTLPDGSKSNINETFDTREECQQFIDRMVGKVAGKEYVDNRKERGTSVRTILERYRKDVIDLMEDAHSRAQKRSMLKKWLEMEWADWPITSIEPEMITEWRNEQLADGLAPSTVKNPMNMLSKIFRLAGTEWGYRVGNPVTGVARPRDNEAREAFLETAQEKALLEACKEGPWQLQYVVRIALATAMRASEIRRLNWKHIDIPHTTVHLPKTKNGSKRDVPLVLPDALEVFEELRGRNDRRADGHIFGHPEKLADDGGYTATMLTWAFARAVDRAAEKNPEFKTLNSDLRFHDLRHVAITRLAPHHHDALDLSKTTGHKTLSVLARYYNEKPSARAERLRKARLAAEAAQAAE
jgi:integrase